mmetsp:Transcript_64532/g.135441  ORF Transcript_64532/g.135441 Transcript_64532/m.135441 type:complete len:395 (-) Transcript_64532:749-1933(-)
MLTFSHENLWGRKRELKSELKRGRERKILAEGTSSWRRLCNLRSLGSLLQILRHHLAGGLEEAGVIRLPLASLGQIASDLLRQHLAQLDTPLVEGVDVPDPALNSGSVLVEGQQLAQGVGIANRKEQGERGSVASEGLVGNEVVWHLLGLQLLRSLAQGQGVRLSEEVRHQLVVVAHSLAWQFDGVLGGREADELGRDGAALMHELVEGVLAVGAWLAKVDGTSSNRHGLASHGHALAVGLHVQLLNVRDESGEGLAVRKHCAALVLQDAGVPDREQAHEHGQILLRSRSEEVLVHLVASLQELRDDAEAILERQWEDADSTPAGESAAHPVPEAEDVLGVDAERGRLVQGRRAGGDVLRDAVGRAELLDEPLLDCLCVEHGLSGGERLRNDQN